MAVVNAPGAVSAAEGVRKRDGGRAPAETDDDRDSTAPGRGAAAASALRLRTSAS